MPLTTALEARAYINGKWVDGTDSPYDVINPATEETLATVAPVSVAQAGDAVAAAREAFDRGAWSRTTAEERSRLLHRLADLIERDSASLADLLIDEIGTPRAIADAVQLPSPIYRLRWNAETALKLSEPGSLWPTPSAAPGTSSVLELAPVGVVFGMAAYNFPLSLAALKMGPALAAGCSIILMSSPKAVLSTTALFRLIDEAGFPPGAVNFVFGTPEIARELCQHNGVDLVSFTGSAAVGRQIAQLAAPTLKRLVLELGGKSADILLPGVNLEEVVELAVRGWTGNAGQGCGCLTRTLVHRSDYSEFLARASALVGQLGCGDPQDPATLVGPLVSRVQRDNVAGYVERAAAGGATIVAGGRAPSAFPVGFFYEPTIVTDVNNSSEVAQEELFGPVSVVLPYDDVDEAVTMANDSAYGLAAAVRGPSGDALAVASRLRAGTIQVNSGGPMLGDHPWGGFKQSGLGREGGVFGLAEFVEPRHILVSG